MTTQFRGYFERRPIDVECILNARGKFHLIAMYWGDKRFEITEYELRHRADNHTGKPCMMFLSIIDGKEKRIYFDDGVFFVEVATN